MSHSAELAYVKRQYAAEDNLAIRIRTHKLYTEPKLDFVAWVLDHINWRGDEVVLDVGCGSGNYVAATRPHARHYVANDFSFGMLSGLEFDGLERVNLNAEKLPYASNSADVILANHMITTSWTPRQPFANFGACYGKAAHYWRQPTRATNG